MPSRQQIIDGLQEHQKGPIRKMWAEADDAQAKVVNTLADAKRAVAQEAEARALAEAKARAEGIATKKAALVDQRAEAVWAEFLADTQKAREEMVREMILQDVDHAKRDIHLEQGGFNGLSFSDLQ